MAVCVCLLEVVTLGVLSRGARLWQLHGGFQCASCNDTQWRGVSSGEKTVWAGSPSAVCGRGVYFCLPLMRQSQIVRITPEWQKARGREAGCGVGKFGPTGMEVV